MSADYPHVRLSPGHRFGRLQIDNIEVETIAASVWTDGVAFTCEGYDLTRPQVLVGCWAFLRYGERRGLVYSTQRRIIRDWAEWLAASEIAMHQSRWDEVADPPMRGTT